MNDFNHSSSRKKMSAENLLGTLNCFGSDLPLKPFRSIERLLSAIQTLRLFQLWVYPKPSLQMPARLSRFNGFTCYIDRHVGLSTKVSLQFSTRKPPFASVYHLTSLSKIVCTTILLYPASKAQNTVRMGNFRSGLLLWAPGMGMG